MSEERKRIYEQEIDPLVQEVIDLCEEHDIPVFMSCQINDVRDGTQTENKFYTSAALPKNCAVTLQVCKEIMVGALGKELMQMLGLGGKQKKADRLDEFLPPVSKDKLN